MSAHMPGENWQTYSAKVGSVPDAHAILDMCAELLRSMDPDPYVALIAAPDVIAELRRVLPTNLEAKVNWGTIQVWPFRAAKPGYWRLVRRSERTRRGP